MLKAEYQTRGPVPQEAIAAVALQLAEPGAGQVRIKVLAAPINPSDVLTLTGEYGMLPPLPAIGGNEGVGRVEALGAEVGNLKVGQMVLLPVGCGTWVSHLNAPANKLPAYLGFPMDNGGFAIFRITAVKQPKEALDPARVEAIKAQLEQTVSQDDFAAYLASLRKEYPVTVNRKLIDNVKQP